MKDIDEAVARYREEMAAEAALAERDLDAIEDHLRELVVDHDDLDFGAVRKVGGLVDQESTVLHSHLQCLDTKILPDVPPPRRRGSRRYSGSSPSGPVITWNSTELITTSRLPLGVWTVTSSPTRLPSNALATGATSEMRRFLMSASCSPTMV